MIILFLQATIYLSKEHQLFFASNQEDYINAINKFSPDVIVADTNYSCINWEESLQLKRKLSPLSSFVLTGVNLDADPISLLKEGVDEIVRINAEYDIPYALYSAGEKKKLRTEKKMIEKSFKDLFENNPAPKFILDPQTRKFLALNKAGEKFYGYSKKEFCQMTIDQVNVLSGEKISRIIENVKRKSINMFTVPHRLRNGEIRYVEIYASIINFEGKVCNHCIIFDVTEKRAVQNKLLKDKNKAEELNKLKTEFMAAMSHELRNPLFGILSNAEFLKNEVHGEQKEEVENLYTSAIRLFTTIEKMLQFSNIKLKQESNQELNEERKQMLESVHPRILIVEDELINMLSLKKMLLPNNIVFTAKDAETALEIVNHEKIEAILMDINLKSDIDGVQLTNIIRKIDKYESIPIIAMTAYAFPGEKERFLSSGFTHYISKPFSSEQLVNLLKTVFALSDGPLAVS